MVRAVHTHDWTGDINPLFLQSGTPIKSTSGLAPPSVCLTDKRLGSVKTF
jgi:hypothetical protein